MHRYTQSRRNRRELCIRSQEESIRVRSEGEKYNTTLSFLGDNGDYDDDDDNDNNGTDDQPHLSQKSIVGRGVADGGTNLHVFPP